MSAGGDQRPLCVAQMLPAMDQGGVERGTLEVAAALVDHGHRALVISGGGRMVAALADAGAEHVELPVGRKSPFGLRLVPTLRRLLVDRRVDVLHLRSRFPAWLGYLAWRGMPETARPGLVTTVHGLYSVSFYSAVMTRGERVIAVSRAVEQYLRANYPTLDPARIQVIHRGVDETRYHRGFAPSAAWLDGWRSAMPHLAGGLVVTLAGRLTRLKGHEDFLELIRRLEARGLPARGLVVGEDRGARRRYAAGLKRRAAAEQLPIDFLGARNDLREIFAVSNVVVSLSRKPESFGRTVVEALALGTPVVGYDHGGVGEILRAVFPGGAVTAGDLDAAARAIGKVHAGELRVEADNPYSLRRMLEQTLAVYLDLAAR
ncbi:MAG: glycosyltransferase family 4 protein [Gammaproteobacteria bacterium]|nr:glycosyltransferase family 4 protein [Gammaproteobacteria bacterium]